MHNTRKTLTVIALMLAAACTSGAEDNANTDGTTPTPGGTSAAPSRLRIVSDFANDTFPEPAEDYIEVSYANSEMLLRPRQGDPEPWLAESVTQQSPTVWRITLRPNLAFQNGKPLDAAALKAWFAWEFEHDPAAKGLLGNPTGVDVVDARAVDVALPKAHNPFPFALANYTFAVYDSVAVAEVGEKYEQLAGKGIFTGPYQYMSTSAGKVTYDANPGYWGGKPAFEGLEVRKLDDQQVGLQAVANGEADLQLVPAVKLKRQSARYPKLTFKTSPLAAGYTAFNLHPSKAPFNELAVRQAFALAIDNDTISSKVMDGVRRPLKGVFPSDFTLAVDWKRHDPAGAEAVLDQAGWKRSDAGVRTKDGRPLTARIITYDDDLEAVGTAAVEMLRDVGFDASLQRLPDYSGIAPELTGDGPVNVQVLNLENFGLDGNPYLAMARNYQFDKSYNLVVRDEEIAELFDTVLSSQDEAEVDKAFRRAQELNGERVYYVPVVDNPTTMLVSEPFASLVVDPFFVFFDGKTAAGS